MSYLQTFCYVDVIFRLLCRFPSLRLSKCYGFSDHRQFPPTRIDPKGDRQVSVLYVSEEHEQVSQYVLLKSHGEASTTRPLLAEAHRRTTVIRPSTVDGLPARILHDYPSYRVNTALSEQRLLEAGSSIIVRVGAGD